jgi:predicted acetyltransferase
MKYVITWDIRPAVDEKAAARSLDVFGKWSPSEGAEFKEFLGRVGIRHRLTPRLRREGGHIGYWIRPTARRQGHATAAFRASLPMAHRLGLDPVLVTTDETNVGSRKIIEAAGGVFERQNGIKRLYWVPTAPGR